MVKGKPGKPGKAHPWWDALFLDMPYIVDSSARRAEYRLNRLHAGGGDVALRVRGFARLPVFWMFVAVLFFCAYGPTLGALCGVWGESVQGGLQDLLGGASLLLALVQFILGGRYFAQRIRVRFERKKLPTQGRRWWYVHALVGLTLAASCLPAAYFGKALLSQSLSGQCLRGPGFGPALVQLGLVALLVPLTAWACRRAVSVRARVGWQSLAVLAVVGLVTALGADGREAAQAPYLHLFAVLAAGLAVMAWAAGWLIELPFHSLEPRDVKQVQDALQATELFADSRQDPTLSPRRVLGGLVVGLVQMPLQFLLLPGFAVLLAPEGFLWHALVAGAVASALLMTATHLTHRWDRLSQYLRRYFLLGVPFFVSMAALLVAWLRLAGVQYVTTLLNVAPFGVLFTGVVMAYALGWWFESQVNSVLGARLLKLLGGTGRLDHELAPYRPSAVPSAALTNVATADRHITCHGLGDFVVLGRLNAKPSEVAFHTYPFLDLFERLLTGKRLDAVHELTRRVQLYFALINLLLAAGLAVLVGHWGQGDETNTVRPVVTASAAPGASPVDLPGLLTQSSGSHAPSAVVVAASGGGTRAALYAATVLKGLHDLQADGRVVLLSGVSGGGVAAAYFVGHREALLQDAPTHCGAAGTLGAWACFQERMTQPFIEDVLQGASEWRVQSDLPLGVLLKESFERRLFGGEALTGMTLGAPAPVGLMLNTTIAGHPLADSPGLAATVTRVGSASGACQQTQRPVSLLSGGRLVFANVALSAPTSPPELDLAAAGLPRVVVSDPRVTLAQAAALTANFPPVFPNARVDLTGFASQGGDCDTRSYFVTDGGATENLGLNTALLALIEATAHRPADRSPRDIDLVLAEASALDFDYHQDRGLGAATEGARERLTGELTARLLAQLRQQVAPAQVRVHDLALPRVFRSRGGFGTHWMFPGSIRLHQPHPLPAPSAWTEVLEQFSGQERHWVTLNKPQLLELWGALYRRSGGFCTTPWGPDPSADLSTVSAWICGQGGGGTPAADGQLARWEALRTQLVRP